MAIDVIPFKFPGIPNVRCVFQTRLGGCSDGAFGSGNISYDVGDDPARVDANIKELRDTLQVPALVFGKQVHGKTLIFDPEPNAEPVECDGMATSAAGIGVAVRSADCQPVLLAHAGGKYVAALHVGWKGNRIGFIGVAVTAFCAHYGIRPAEVFAVRGPSLGPACSEFVNYDKEWSHYFDAWYDARTQTVNLWRLTRDQLMTAGVLAEHIFGIDLCTSSLPEMFFSFRNNAVTGRQASVIWIGN